MKKNPELTQTTKKAKAKSYTPKQLFWLILGILISVNALIFLVLGLINDYAPLAYSPFETPNNAMASMLYGIDFKWFGVITLILGTIIYSLALSFATKAQEREEERVARRRQRRLFASEGEKVVASFDNTTSAVTSMPLPESNDSSK